MAKRIRVPDTGTKYKSGVPTGEGSKAYEAKVVGPPVEQPRKAARPGPDVEGQNRFHRGATRAWNAIRPKATRSR